MKYPIGIQTFEQLIQDGYVYVDKTDLVYKLTHEGKIYFLSRPRRFGKSLLVSTLDAYYSGRKELFEGLKIASMEKEWAKYPVFRLDFNGSYFTEGDALDRKLENQLNYWESIYGKNDIWTERGDRFAKVLKRAHEQTGRRCVVLIDEYDKPLLDVMNSGKTVTVDGKEIDVEERNRGLLKAFYSVFKAADEDLQFVLLTGVTKFSQVSVFSGFNQPEDISMSMEFETLCGITEDEVREYFKDSIAQMAQFNRMTYEEGFAMLKRQYDGYHFSSLMTDIYNPFSLLTAFKQKQFNSYWFSSGTPEYLIRLLSQSNENLNEMIGKWYPASEFVDYKATAQKPLPMIYQSGYLTIKDVNIEDRRFLLGIPNSEVKDGFVSLVAADYLKVDSGEFGDFALDLRNAMDCGDTAEAMKLLTAFWASLPYDLLEKTRERHFQYTIYLIFTLISVWRVCSEVKQSQGRADCIVEAKNHVYIFEFKLNGSAQEALGQIEAKGYAAPYATDPRPIHKLGVNFSSETGTIAEWLESLI